MQKYENSARYFRLTQKPANRAAVYDLRVLFFFCCQRQANCINYSIFAYGLQQIIRRRM